MKSYLLVLCFTLACLTGSLQAQVVNAQMEYDVLNSSELNYTLTSTSSGDYFTVVSNHRMMSSNGIFTGLSFIMLDECLDTLWHRHWDCSNLTQPTDSIFAYDVEEVAVGFLISGKIVTGVPGSTIVTTGWAMTTDPFGNVIHFRTFDDLEVVYTNTELTSMDGYILAGQGPLGATILRVNPDLTGGGPLPWGLTFYQTLGYPATFYDVIHTMGNNLALTGEMTDATGDVNALVVSIDEFGTHNWSNTYSSGLAPHSKIDIGRGLAFEDSHLYLTGDYIEIAPPNPIVLDVDILGMQLDLNSGTLLWSKHFDLGSLFTMGSNESGQKILVGHDGNLRVTGTVLFGHATAANQDGFLLQHDPGGTPMLSTVFTDPGSEWLYQIEQDGSGTYTMAGTRDNKLFAVQKSPILSLGCADSNFYPLVADIVYTPATVSRMAADTTTAPVAYQDTAFLVGLDTICEPCKQCESQNLAAASNYYHVIDVEKTLAIQGFMNEGDYYDDQGDYKMVFTHTNTQYGMDVSVTKADESGTIIWSKVYSSRTDEEAYTVRRTQDGNFIVLGATHISSNVRQPFLMKISDNGDVLWTKTYESDYNAAGMKMIQHSSGDFVVISITNPWIAPSAPHYPIIFTTDDAGNLKHYKLMQDVNTREWDHLTDLMEDSNNDIVAVGRGGHNNDYNPGMIWKFDINLGVVWKTHQRFNSVSGSYDLTSPNDDDHSHLKLYAVEQVGTDYYVAGYVSDDHNTGSNGSFRHAVLMKYNSSGVYQSHTAFAIQGQPADHLQPFDLRLCANGELVMAGLLRPDGADDRTFVMRVSLSTSTATVVHANSYGDGERNRGTWIREAFNNQFIVTGDHGSTGLSVRPYYMRINADLSTVECNNELDIEYPTVSFSNQTINYNLVDENIENDHTFNSWEICPIINTCTGAFTPTPASSKWARAEYLDQSPSEYLDESPVEFDQSLTVYPNPVTDQAAIRFNLRGESDVTIEIYDIMGAAKSSNLIQPQHLEEGPHDLRLNVSELAAGTYICVLNSNEGRHVVRFVVTR